VIGGKNGDRDNGEMRWSWKSDESARGRL